MNISVRSKVSTSLTYFKIANIPKSGYLVTVALAASMAIRFERGVIPCATTAYL